MGNAFNSCSYLVVLATALSSAELETRRPCSTGDAPSPSADLAAMLGDGDGYDLEADLVRLFEAEGVLISESEDEITD